MSGVFFHLPCNRTEVDLSLCLYKGAGEVNGEDGPVTPPVH